MIESNPMPTVTKCLQDHDIDHRVFSCDPEKADTADFCQHYGFSPSQSANAIIVASKKEPIIFACCLVLATTKLDVNKKVKKLLGVRKVSFATAEQTIALTSMKVGGVTIFGLPEIPIYVDSRLKDVEEVVLGGGNRSSKILIHPQQLEKLPGLQFIEGLALDRD